MIRMLIADDHTMVREGLVRLLRSVADVEVVAEAGNGHEVIEQVRALELDLLLLDMTMPGRPGIELIQQVKREKPALKILVLSMHREHQYAVRAIRAGAAGYLTKESASAQLVDAIRKVASGGAFVSAEVAQQLALRAMPGAQADPHEALSDREFQILRMIGEGLSLTDIAARLNLSVKTVSTHKGHVQQKLNLSGTADLVRYAITHRLVDDPSG